MSEAYRILFPDLSFQARDWTCPPCLGNWSHNHWTAGEVYLCSVMSNSLPPLGSSVHGIFQPRILEWIAISFSRGSSWPKEDLYLLYLLHCRQILYHCATGEALREVSRTVLNDSIKPISSLIPKMSTFTLAISCLTTSNLPWFVDLTFQVPMQYCSLQHQTLVPSPVTSTTGCCFCFGSVSSFFLELFLHWSP